MKKVILIVMLTISLIVGCVQQPPESTTPAKETNESCTIGWKCLDEHRKGYQFSNCALTKVNICKDGCKDGECITEAPLEEEKEETFSLTEGMGTIKDLKYKNCDFSKGQIFQDGVYEPDLRVKRYAKSSGYNYFEVESSEPNIWIIEKKIAEATRADCIEKIADAKEYNYLRSGQTVCVKTKENNIALVGGYWQGSPTEDTKLRWKYYS